MSRGLRPIRSFIFLFHIFKKLSYFSPYLIYKWTSTKLKTVQFAFSVHNDLGLGLLESAYEGAFCVELAFTGISYERHLTQRKGAKLKEKIKPRKSLNNSPWA